LHAVRYQLGDWLIVIAGADEFDHKRVVLEKIEQLNLKPFVRFTGLLDGEDKRNAFAAASIFVLPTKRENFSIAVLEALGAGVPVLTTKGAPWADLVSNNSGWWVDVSVEAMANALKCALGTSQQELGQMGQRGRILAEEKYRWEHSAKMTIELYQWLIGRGDRPDFVVVD
jgi:glycosyltransferase involved in cell wall biosynthesis